MKLGSAQYSLSVPQESRFRNETSNLQERQPEQGRSRSDSSARVQYTSGVAYDLQDRVPPKHLPHQQRAIGFYELTASLSGQGGDGELIGVDTYA